MKFHAEIRPSGVVDASVYTLSSENGRMLLRTDNPSVFSMCVCMLSTRAAAVRRISDYAACGSADRVRVDCDNDPRGTAPMYVDTELVFRGAFVLDHLALAVCYAAAQGYGRTYGETL